MTRLTDRLTATAALAVVLASTALSPLFADLRWLPDSVGAVLVVATAGLLLRRLGTAGSLQLLLLAAVGVGYLVVSFADNTLSYGVLPGPRTWTALQHLVHQGWAEVQTYAAPVPTRDGVVLLAVAGVTAVAVVVDTVTVLLRRPALAGLPLLILFAVPSAVRPGGVGTIPFLLTAAGWLSLLLIEGGERVDRWGAPLRPAGHGGRREDRGVARVGRRIGAAAVGAAVVVPIAVPGLDAQLVNGQDGIGGKGRGHTATTYNPITRLRGDLVRPNATVLLHYTTNDVSPDYLRLTTLDRYDGTQWVSSQLNGDPTSDAVQKGIPTPVGLRDSATTVRVISDRVRIDALHTNWLPVPFPPTRVTIGGAWLWDSRAETVFSAAEFSDFSHTPYTVTAARVTPTAADLHDAESLPAVIAPYTDPPLVTKYVAAQAALASRGALTELGKARALQNYFQDPTRFHYSTSSNVPNITTPDALERFLRGGAGFCEQFASAMAAMLRYLGIPSRVAVGFTPGTRQADGSYVVTTHDAHAWPEVWFAAAGWVRFEPTPRAGAATIPDYAAPDNAGAGANGTPAPLPSGGTIGLPAAPKTTGKDLDRALHDNGSVTSTARAAGRRSGPPTAALAVGGALLLVLGLPRLAFLARRRWRRGEPGAAAAWALVRDDAGDVGLAWRAADSPRAAAARLLDTAGLTPLAATALRHLAAAAEQERFGRPGQTPTVPWAELVADVARVRRSLLRQADLRRRAKAVLLPPSTLRWAADAVTGRAADLLDLVDGALGWAGRWGRRQAAG